MSYTSNSLDIINVLKETINDDEFESKILNIAKEIESNTDRGKITAIFGNGGSAADAQHFAAELVCTYKDRNRKPYKAIALTTDASIITAWANDFNYDTIFKRQIEAFDETIGFLIGLSTSGQSKNVINALNSFKDKDITTCLICGENEIDYKDINLVLKVPSKHTPTIQTVTQVVYHSICDFLEK